MSATQAELPTETSSAIIAILAGDGIGPEVMEVSWPVVQKAAFLHGLTLNGEEALIGGAAIDAKGSPLPEETLELCRNSQAIFFGSVGGPQWTHLPPNEQPERGALLPLRKEFGLFANLRPGICYAQLANASPLKAEIVGDGFDILCVRELTGGVYFGQPKSRGVINGEEVAIDTMRYGRSEIERIAHLGFEAAMKRGCKLCSVDKANVLQNSLLWRDVVEEIAHDYPQVELSHMFVDNAAMQLVKDPKQFDVILTENLFGDILSDELAQITGSMGMLPSASLGEAAKGEQSFGLYEPSGGSAPDIADQGIANPIAQILSGAMMLRFSLAANQAADALEKAVEQALEAGYRTPDIATGAENETLVGTKEMAEQVAGFLA